jgi:DNA-binding SARP family transcriptional activator
MRRYQDLQLFLSQASDGTVPGVRTRAPRGHALSPKYSLTLLGRFELSRTDEPLELPNKKLAALLAYLACTAPEPQSREKLATLLWGAHFETQARQNLRQALFRLRRALDDEVLASDGEEVSLAVGAIDCDVGRLEALIREGSQASLAAAVDLYKGRLLADVNISEEAWADWVAGERQRLEGLALDAQVRFGEIELTAGHPDKALETAHRALAINNLREDAHRLMVQALAAAGRKAEALKHYQCLVALLKRELNAEPDAATKSLVAELGNGHPPPRSCAVNIVEPAQSDRSSIAVLPSPTMRKDTGQAANAGEPADPGDQSAMALRSSSPEQRQLTIMVCNAVGSVSLAAALDPEDLRDRIATFHRMAADVVARFDGFVAQYLSDGVVVYFGYPAADEHDAERAVRAGLAMLDAAGTLKASFHAALDARVGIATGLVVVGESAATGDTRQPVAIGEAPILAEQLQAAASPGEIVIAASTRRLVGRLFDCRAAPAVKANGQLQPIEGLACARRDGRRQPVRGAA